MTLGWMCPGCRRCFSLAVTMCPYCPATQSYTVDCGCPSYYVCGNIACPRQGKTT